MNISFNSVKNAEAIIDLRDSLPREKKNLLQVRHWESGWRGSIFDGKKAMLLVKKHRTEPLDQSKGTPGTDITHYYEGWVTEDRKWVKYIQEWWDYFWKKAENAPVSPTSLIATIKEIVG